MTDFIVNHSGSKVSGGILIPSNQIPFNGQELSDVNLDYEEPGAWNPIPFANVTGWKPGEWEYSPLRFVDGKDVGKVVAHVKTPDGWPIPVRVSHIGGITARIDGREILKEKDSEYAERAVTMLTTPFPWDEVEEFAIALQNAGFRLLPVSLDQSSQVWEFQKVLKATDARSREEMNVLEEAALGRTTNIPTIVDGRLESHSGGFDSRNHPVFGVIKSHQHIPLDLPRLKLLYNLNPGERLPAFTHTPIKRLPVLSWYLKISDSSSQLILDGIVRLEVSLEWYENHAKYTNFLERLSRLAMAYRCQRTSYSRAHISLEPIVRCETFLSATFGNYNQILNHFLFLTHIN